MATKIELDTKPKNHLVNIVGLFILLALVGAAINSLGKSFSPQAFADAEIMRAQMAAQVDRYLEDTRHIKFVNMIGEAKLKTAAETYINFHVQVQRITVPVLYVFAASVCALVLGLSTGLGGWGIGMGAAGVAFGGRAIALMIYEFRRALNAPVVTPLPDDARYVIVNHKVIERLTGRIASLEADVQESKLIAQASNADHAIEVAGHIAERDKAAAQAVGFFNIFLNAVNELRKGK